VYVCVCARVCVCVYVDVCVNCVRARACVCVCAWVLMCGKYVHTRTQAPAYPLVPSRVSLADPHAVGRQVGCGEAAHLGRVFDGEVDVRYARVVTEV